MSYNPAIMVRNPNILPAVLLAVCVAMLGGAYAFQYLGGLQPCPLCLYQRWPWWIAGGLAALTMISLSEPRLRRGVLAFSGVAVWVGAAIAMYHTGVEQHWWTGPSSCSGAATPDNLETLRAQILAAPIIRCDEIPWSLFGISMAGYNALISLATGAGLFWWLRLERARDA